MGKEDPLNRTKKATRSCPPIPVTKKWGGWLIYRLYSMTKHKSMRSLQRSLTPREMTSRHTLTIEKKEMESHSGFRMERMRTNNLPLLTASGTSLVVWNRHPLHPV